MKVVFLSELEVRLLPDGRWQLTADFKSEARHKNWTQAIVVPKGFITDFASVPRLPFAYLLAGGIVHKAAVIHDWLYAIGQTKGERELADQVFHAAMKEEGIPLLQRSLMYVAVRAFGGSYFEERDDPTIEPPWTPGF